MGMPTVIIQRPELNASTQNAFIGQGLPPEVPWVTFPYALILADSDLSVINPKKQEIFDALTVWKPKGTYTKGQMITRTPLEVTGKDYADLYKNVQLAYITKQWGDGWPVWPTDKARIDWIMTGAVEARDTKKGPNDLVGGGDGKVYPKGGILTEEVMATCVSMAGGRPEYMAWMEAICQAVIASQNTTLASSMSAYPITLLNGPGARDIRVSSGFSCMTNDPVRPGGSAIRRAVWFVHQGTGGETAGLGSVAQYGYIRPGLCFREDEEERPKGWKTYTEERYGRSAGTNSATTGLTQGGAIRDFTHRGTGGEPNHKIELTESFDRFRSTVMTFTTGSVPANMAGSTMLWLINSAVCNDMVINGWPDKEQIKKQAADNLWYSLSDIIDQTGVQRAIAQAKTDISKLPQKILFCTDPQRLHLVVAGGNHPSRSCIIPSWVPFPNVEVFVPKNQPDLLAQAEKDLGILPESD
jgi:hypothetical protein